MVVRHPMKTVITHPGSAHKDDFLACSVLLARHRIPLERRDPLPEELEDPEIAIVDIGHRHEPAKSNFDHHQFDRDHVPTCSLSLILQDIGLYEDARSFCDWLETAEWFDCRGAIETAKWLGVPRRAIDQLNSPMDVTLLRCLAACQRLEPGDPLWEMMQKIGQDLLDYVTGMRKKIEWLKETASLWSIGDASILFIPRTEPLPDDPRSGVGFYLREAGLEKDVIGIIYPDRRGTGFGLSRYEDNLKLDFTRIKDEPDVHFAHARGFLAKTDATEPERLKELAQKALV